LFPLRCLRNRPLIGRQSCAASSTRRCWRLGGWTVFRPSCPISPCFSICTFARRRLLFELDMEPGVPMDDVREVSNYVAALDHGLKRLAEGFPLSLRLIKEMHSIRNGTARIAFLDVFGHHIKRCGQGNRTHVHSLFGENMEKGISPGRCRKEVVLCQFLIS